MATQQRIQTEPYLTSIDLYRPVSTSIDQYKRYVCGVSSSGLINHIPSIDKYYQDERKAKWIDSGGMHEFSK